jgi:hypothetical protein
VFLRSPGTGGGARWRRRNATDADKPGTDFEPGKVDEDQHGWARTLRVLVRPKSASLRQQESVGIARHARGLPRRRGQDRDLTPDGVEESKARRGEDMVEEEGKEPGCYDSGTQGKSERPVGGSTARDSTGVNPQEPIKP